MRLSTSNSLTLPLLLLANLGSVQVSAQEQWLWKPRPGTVGTGMLPALVARQDDNDCSILQSCSECYGKGNVLCDEIACFNPSGGEQCCKNGYSCVALDNSCCEGGPGTTGKDGIPKIPTTTVSDPVVSTSFTCTKDDDNEDCCQKAGKNFHWCSGEFPSRMCYNSGLQTCCTDGTVCEGKDCCDIVGAESVTTNPADNTASASSSSSTGTSGNVPETATITATPTSSNLAVGMNGVVGSVATVAAGVLGLALL